eukprot:gene7797-9936_t
MSANTPNSRRSTAPALSSTNNATSTTNNNTNFEIDMLINEHLAQIAKLDLEHRNTVLERDNEKFAFCDEIGISVESKT